MILATRVTRTRTDRARLSRASLSRRMVSSRRTASSTTVCVLVSTIGTVVEMERVGMQESVALAMIFVPLLVRSFKDLAHRCNSKASTLIAEAQFRNAGTGAIKRCSMRHGRLISSARV